MANELRKTDIADAATLNAAPLALDAELAALRAQVTAPPVPAAFRRVVRFTEPASWTVPAGVTVARFVLASGGGQGASAGIGGTSGEVRTHTMQVVPGTVYRMSVAPDFIGGGGLPATQLIDESSGTKVLTAGGGPAGTLNAQAQLRPARLGLLPVYADAPTLSAPFKLGGQGAPGVFGGVGGAGATATVSAAGGLAVGSGGGGGIPGRTGGGAGGPGLIEVWY